MKTQYQSASLALWLDTEEASRWRLLGFEDDFQDQLASVATVVQSRFCKLTTLLIALVAWTHLHEMQHNRNSREHLHNLSTYSLQSMIAVSAKAWHAILYLITPLQSLYLQRLGMLFYILSRLGSISRGLACYSISHHALAVSSKAIAYHVLAVSAEAWHAILYLITPDIYCHSSATQ